MEELIFFKMAGFPMKTLILLLVLLISTAKAFTLSNSLSQRISRNVRSSQKQIQMGIDVNDPYWKVTLEAENSEAEIAALGACVTSFKVGGYDILFCRPDAVYDGSKPISGGIPICWPQFGPGDIQQHGFARNLNWELYGMTYGNSTSALFMLESNDQTREIWNHEFEAYYNVTLSPRKLNVKMTVTNTGESSFDFTGALHSYFRTSSIDKIVVKGPFGGAKFIDKTFTPPEELVHQDADVTVRSFTDRIFPGVSKDVVLEDRGAGRLLKIHNLQGFEDTVVWSPYGDEGMGADNFVCIESGNIAESITVEPGSTWVGEMELEPGTL
mmetsp:Transcript_22744/g.29552  ORF Transcript_22744/g.29552 Transcript_22744/m.29552 type:complete len:327 (-) Transcript_22744:223-1203(-)